VNFIIILILNIVSLWSFSDESQLSLETFWDAIKVNDHIAAKENLELALSADPENYRAHLGLSLLYKLEKNYTESSSNFETALELLNYSDPYLFAYFNTDTYHNTINHNKALIKKFNKMLKLKDLDPLIRINLQVALFNYYSSNRKFDKANSQLEAIGFIENWSVIGPFPNAAGSGFERIFQPELSFEPHAEYEGIFGNIAEWLPAKRRSNYPFIELSNYFGFSQATYYANCFIYSPTKRKIQIRF